METDVLRRHFDSDRSPGRTPVRWQTAGLAQAALVGLSLGVCLGLPLGLVVALFGSAGGAVFLLILAGTSLAFILWSDAILHRVFRARLVAGHTAPELVTIAGRLSQAYGIARPAVGLIDISQANAMATRPVWRGGAGTILLSPALLKDLTRDEAEAVVAVLIARLQRPEIQAAQVGAALGAMGTILYYALVSGAALLRLSDPDRLPGRLAGAVALASAPAAALLVRVVGGAPLSLAADRDAASVLDNPMALARALIRLDGLARETASGAAERHPATGHVFLVDPLRPSRASAFFESHPSVDLRVADLKRLSGVDGSDDP